jgi:uncharacterized protein YjdB
MKKITRLIILSFFFFVGKMSFAQTVVVPNSLEGTTSTGSFLGPLANSARTYQLLLHEDQLTALQGQQLTGIAFRSLASISSTWPDIEAIYESYEIYLSPSVDPLDRSLTFSENIAGPQVQVRSGSLTIAPGSYPAGGTTSFGPTINFDSSYSYTGGHLLVEIKHTGSNTTSRSVEALTTTNPLYWVVASACWASGTTATGGMNGNAAVIQFSYTTGDTIAVTDITVSTEDDLPAEINTLGGTLQLLAEITPSNATNQNVIWSVESGNDIASVNSNGLVTALYNGVATIRATSAENGTIYDEIQVLVEYEISVTNIEVFTQDVLPAEITTLGGTLQLIAEITPSDATNQEVIWSVESGSEIASVDQNGLVTALANGIATIRATSSENDMLYDEIDVTVNYAIPVTVIEVYTQDEVPAEINTIGGTLQLIAEIFPADATNQEIIWVVVLGEELASVDQNGLVTALDNGFVVIRAIWAEDDAIYGEIGVTINTLSVENIVASSLKYYPNPVVDRFHLEAEQIISEVNVYNMLGQKVLDVEMNSSQGNIDFSSIPKGNYIIKVVVDGLPKIFNIIKN